MQIIQSNLTLSVMPNRLSWKQIPLILHLLTHNAQEATFFMSETAFQFLCLLHLFSQQETFVICVHSP